MTTYLTKGRWRIQLESLQVDVDRQRADFLYQHVERLRHAGFDLVLALDDVLVDLGPPVDVIGLDREHLLQRVRRAIRFQRPHFHFAKALAAELRLAAKRLLRDQAVRTSGERM